LTGNRAASEEQRKAGLPQIYIFPSSVKSMPYTRVITAPYAEELIKDIVDKCKSPMTKLRSDVEKGTFEGMGKRSKDEEAF
jgi:hypothetical protein